MRYCRQCSSSHDPPTGKKCRNEARGPSSDGLTHVLEKLSAQMDQFGQRLAQVEGAARAQTPPTSSPGLAQPVPVVAAFQPPVVAAPPSADHSKEVERQLQELQVLQSSDDDEDPEVEAPSQRGKSKSLKSGRTITSLSEIKKRIAWPHFYVKKGPDRKPAEYDGLTLPEFVHGFLAMLRQERSVGSPHLWQKVSLLSDLMRDSENFGWGAAHAFFGTIMEEFEQDNLTWADSAQIAEKRCEHLLTLKVQNANSSAPSKRVRYCGPFQQGRCSFAKDHVTQKGLVAHICAHCFKSSGALFPHPEKECKKKAEAKNEKKDSGTKE